MIILDLIIKVIIQDYQDIMGRISGSYIEIALVAVSVVTSRYGIGVLASRYGIGVLASLAVWHRESNRLIDSHINGAPSVAISRYGIGVLAPLAV